MSYMEQKMQEQIEGGLHAQEEIFNTNADKDTKCTNCQVPLGLHGTACGWVNARQTIPAGQTSIAATGNYKRPEVAKNIVWDDSELKEDFIIDETHTKIVISKSDEYKEVKILIVDKSQQTECFAWFNVTEVKTIINFLINQL